MPHYLRPFLESRRTNNIDYFIKIKIKIRVSLRGKNIQCLNVLTFTKTAQFAFWISNVDYYIEKEWKSNLRAIFQSKFVLVWESDARVAIVPVTWSRQTASLISIYIMGNPSRAQQHFTEITNELITAPVFFIRNLLRWLYTCISAFGVFSSITPDYNERMQKVYGGTASC